MNRAQRRAAQHARSRVKPARRINPIAGLRALDHSRTYNPDEMLEQHNINRVAFERLRTGHGDEWDFNRMSMIFNVGLVRSEAISLQLVDIMVKGQMALVRMRDRRQRGLPFGFDAQGITDVPEALDTYEAMTGVSTPMQMKLAVREAYARVAAGELLEIPA